MRVFAVALGCLTACAIGVGADPADAATKKKKRVVVAPVTYVAPSGALSPDHTVVRIDGVTRIIVNRRSYLDAGTEVSTGDRGYHDYANPPGGDPGRSNWNMGPDVRGAGRWPLPSAFDLPGYNPNTPF